MNKLLKRILIISLVLLTTFNSLVSFQNANAKNYTSYTSPVFQYWDSPNNYDFYSGPYRKQLPTKLVVNNPVKGGALQFAIPKLIISKNGKTIYTDSDMSSGMIDYMQFTSTKKGYLNMFYLLGDKNGNIEYTLLAVSPTGKNIKKRKFNAVGGVKSIKFISLNKVKIINYSGFSKIHTFNKLKIK